MTQSAGARVLPRGTLYLWPEGILFVGSDMVNEMHRHFTASVLIALSGEFRVTTGSGDSASYGGLLVAPNAEQAMDATGSEVVILQVDPETHDFARIAHWFERQGPLCVLPADVLESVRANARAVIDGESFHPSELWRTIIHALSISGVRPREIDPRIREVLTSLKENVLSPPSAAELAEKVNLSEGRLIHLFTEQMGLPMRRYTLWLRLRDAFLTLAEGASLTEAAHRAGFADSAHMTRTFRGMFGIPPSFFKEGRGRVRTEFSITPDAKLGPHPGDQERWERVLDTRERK